MRRRVEFNFSCVAQEMEGYFLDPPRVVKNKEYALEVVVWECTWIVNAWNFFFLCGHISRTAAKIP